MERNILLGSLGLGVLGWLCTLLLAQPRHVPDRDTLSPDILQDENATPFLVPRPFLAFALLLPLLVWLATLPVHAPFSAGQGWGRGFLLGGIGALASFFTISRATSTTAPNTLALRITATAPLFAVLAIACVPLLWMRHAVIDVLMGEGLAWVSVSLVLLLGQSSTTRPSSTNSNSVSSGNLGALLLTNGAAFAATLCTVAALGIYRDFVIGSVARGTFPAVGMALGSIIALSLLISAFVSEALAHNRALRVFIIALLTLVLPLIYGYLLGMKLLNDITLIAVIGVGLVLGALLLWLVADEVTRSAATTTTPGDATALRLNYVPIWGVLVALCGFMFAYQTMQGFGVGLMLLAAWPVSLLALPSLKLSISEGTSDFGAELRNAEIRAKIAHSLTLLLSIVAVLLISRLFTTRFRTDLRGVGLSDQFALFGFVIGAAAPALVAGLWFAPQKAAPALGRLGLVGLIAIAIPIGILAIWGAKVTPALFAGLALAIAGFTPVASSRLQPLAVALLALAPALTIAQWTHRLAPLATMSRLDRMHLLLWVLGALVLLALIFDYSSRFANKLRQDNTLPPVTPRQGTS